MFPPFKALPGCFPDFFLFFLFFLRRVTDTISFMSELGAGLAGCFARYFPSVTLAGGLVPVALARVFASVTLAGGLVPLTSVTGL